MFRPLAVRSIAAAATVSAVAIGCSAQPAITVYLNDGGASDGAVVVDAAAICNQPGSLACDATLTTLCARAVQCCSSSSAPFCSSWALSVASCKAHWVETGYNCADATYSTRLVCPVATSSCSNDIPLIACDDLFGATANWPVSCVNFWNQYR